MKTIFEDPTSASLFTVLRNGDLLPAELIGCDLDVSCIPPASIEQVVDHIQERAQLAGWTTVSVSRRPHMIGMSIIQRDCADGNGGLHIDVFDGISYLGMPLLSAEWLAGESTLGEGVRRLSRRGRVAATVAHHIAWVGGLHKDAYREDLEQLLASASEREWFFAEMRRILGQRIAGRLADPGLRRALTSYPPKRRAVTLIELLAAQIRKRPLGTAFSLSSYVAGQVPSLLHPSGIVGCYGDSSPRMPGRRLTLEIACRLSPHGFGIPHVRAGRREVSTLNGKRYELWLERMWSRWWLLRWTLPSVFLWLQAKRSRMVVVQRLPLALRYLRSRRWGPGWLAKPGLSSPEA